MHVVAKLVEVNLFDRVIFIKLIRARYHARSLVERDLHEFTLVFTDAVNVDLGVLLLVLGSVLVGLVVIVNHVVNSFSTFEHVDTAQTPYWSDVELLAEQVPLFNST